MREITYYVADVKFYSERDIDLTISALRGAARDWASCSNESEPLLTLADQLERQANV